MTEEGHQICLFRWAHLARNTRPALRMLYAIPNGGLRHPAVAAKLKAAGLKPGVPDICLAVPRGCWASLYIELKAPAYAPLNKRAGTTSAEQEMWLEDLHGYGFKCLVCHGWEEAKDAILEYLDA
jgi:hypothetical protein